MTKRIDKSVEAERKVRWLNCPKFERNIGPGFGLSSRSLSKNNSCRQRDSVNQNNSVDSKNSVGADTNFTVFFPVQFFRFLLKVLLPILFLILVLLRFFGGPNRTFVLDGGREREVVPINSNRAGQELLRHSAEFLRLDSSLTREEKENWICLGLKRFSFEFSRSDLEKAFPGKDSARLIELLENRSVGNDSSEFSNAVSTTGTIDWLDSQFDGQSDSALFQAVRFLKEIESDDSANDWYLFMSDSNSIARESIGANSIEFQNTSFEQESSSENGSESVFSRSRFCYGNWSGSTAEYVRDPLSRLARFSRNDILVRSSGVLASTDSILPVLLFPLLLCHLFCSFGTFLTSVPLFRILSISAEDWLKYLEKLGRSLFSMPVKFDGFDTVKSRMTQLILPLSLSILIVETERLLI